MGTLLIGDEIVRQLDIALRTIPGTLPIWRSWRRGPTIEWWANGDELDATIKGISEGVDGAAPEKLPDTVVVSLGRVEILTEPNDVTQKDLDVVTASVAKLVERLKALGLKVLWLLPPAAKSEGKVRAAIAKTLADKGVRAFPADRKWMDPSPHGGPPIDLPETTINEIAALLATWGPVGSPRAGPLGPRHQSLEEGVFAGTFSPSSVRTSLSNLSRPAKWGLALGALVLGGGIVYAVRRR
jgi:hypothetical protein